MQTSLATDGRYREARPREPDYAASLRRIAATGKGRRVTVGIIRRSA